MFNCFFILISVQAQMPEPNNDDENALRKFLLTLVIRLLVGIIIELIKNWLFYFRKISWKFSEL